MVVTLFLYISAVAVLLGLMWWARESGRGESLEELGRLKAEKEVQGEELRLVKEDLDLDRARVVNLDAQLAKVKSQKKSSEVRTGMIVEQMAPFLEGFPYDPRAAIFLGRPLDFVVFDEEGIHFVEVKSGKAQLNSNQRRIRDQLKEKKVTFEVYRIKGE